VAVAEAEEVEVVRDSEVGDSIVLVVLEPLLELAFDDDDDDDDDDDIVDFVCGCDGGCWDPTIV